MNADLYDKQIQELYLKKGMAMNKIAAQLNISVGKVFNRIKIMDIPVRKKNDYPVSEKVISHASALGKSR